MFSDGSDKPNLEGIIQEYYFQAGFDSFNDYLETIISFLESERQKHNKTIDEINKMINHGEAESLEDPSQASAPLDYAYDRLASISDFENALFTSFFVTIYSYLESELTRHCKNLEKENPGTLSLSDVIGHGVQKALTYLVKVQQIEFSLSASAEWSEIQNYNLLRNCIIHNQGRLDEGFEKSQREKLERYIQAPNTKIELENTWILLSKDFCINALDIIRAFLHSIIFAEKKI